MQKKFNESEAWLREQYIDKNRSAVSIANELLLDNSTIVYWLKKYNIPHHPTWRLSLS